MPKKKRVPENRTPQSAKGFTPAGNTGVQSTQTQFNFNSFPSLEALIDWLQGTFPQKHYFQVKKTLESYFNDKFAKSNSLRFYQNSERSTKGLLIADTPRQGGAVQQRTDAYLEINATCLATLHPEVQQKLFQELDEFEFKPSRIDLTLDDYTKELRPLTLYNEYIKGNVKGFKNTATWHQSGAPGSVAGTFSIGKRGKSGSGKYFQCYDKFLESDGEIDSVRFELRLSQDKAKQAFESLIERDWRNWDQIIGGYISGSIDFIDRSKSVNANRCPRIKWWAKFINRFERIRFRTRIKKVQTIERLENWMNKQVFPSFSALMECHIMEFGLESWNNWLYESIFKASDRRNDQLNALIELATVQACGP